MDSFDSSHKEHQTTAYSLRLVPIGHQETSSQLLPLYDVASLSALEIASCTGVYEDAKYQLELASEEEIDILGARVSINGDDTTEISVMGIAPTYITTERKMHRVKLTSAESKLFSLTYGFARISITLFTPEGTLDLSTADIPCFSNKHSEGQIIHMIDSLLDSESEVLNWMFANGSESGLNYTLFEGGLEKDARKSISTFVQVAEEVARFLEGSLNYFRMQARSAIRKESVRVSGRDVRTVSPNDLQWLFRNVSVLAPTTAETAIEYDGRNYQPRYMQTERTNKSFDLYEHRLLFALIDDVLRACASLEQGVSKGIESTERIAAKMRGNCPEGYCMPSLVLVDRILAKEGNIANAARNVRLRLLRLRQLYREALPGVTPMRLRKPVLTKPAQELRTYNQLYRIAVRWYSHGDFSLAKESLVFHSLRLDKLYEYYVLLSLLEILRGRGFAPDPTFDNAIECATYSVRSRMYTPERAVCTVYRLSLQDISLTLYYRPIIYGWETEEHGITLHRATKQKYMNPNSKDSYFEPDYLLKINGSNSAEQWFVMDAKFSTFLTLTRSHGDKPSTFSDSLRKYQLETFGKDSSVSSVWLICGREPEQVIQSYGNSAWLSSQCPEKTSGLVALSNSKDGLALVISNILTHFEKQQEIPAAAVVIPDSNNAPNASSRTEDSVAQERQEEDIVPVEGVASDEAVEPENTEPNETGEISEKIIEPEESTRKTNAETPLEGNANKNSNRKAKPKEHKVAKKTKEGHKEKSQVKTGEKKPSSEVLRITSPQDVFGEAKELIEKIYPLMVEKELLFNSQWSQKNVKISRPLLRKSPLKSPKEKKYYTEIKLGEENLFFYSAWNSPLALNPLHKLLREIESVTTKRKDEAAEACAKQESTEFYSLFMDYNSAIDERARLSAQLLGIAPTDEDIFSPKWALRKFGLKYPVLRKNAPKAPREKKLYIPVELSESTYFFFVGWNVFPKCQKKAKELVSHARNNSCSE